MKNLNILYFQCSKKHLPCWRHHKTKKNSLWPLGLFDPLGPWPLRPFGPFGPLGPNIWNLFFVILRAGEGTVYRPSKKPLQCWRRHKTKNKRTFLALVPSALWPLGHLAPLALWPLGPFGLLSAKIWNLFFVIVRALNPGALSPLGPWPIGPFALGPNIWNSSLSFLEQVRVSCTDLQEKPLQCWRHHKKENIQGPWPFRPLGPLDPLSPKVWNLFLGPLE